MLRKLLVLGSLAAVLLSGCSEKATKVGLKAVENNGIRIELAMVPDPPQSGDNKVVLRLTDLTSGQPVVNANVTVSAYNELAGGGDRESGRSQGNGEYDVPVKLPIPDSYKLDIEVQRPGEQDADATFTIDAS